MRIRHGNALFVKELFDIFVDRKQGGPVIIRGAPYTKYVVDAAFNSMSGLTSQPALNSIVAAMQNSERETGLRAENLQPISEYWRDVRPVYKGFESELVTSTAEIYKYEIPGGQYSNLKPQVESFGLGHKFDDVKSMYKTVNNMLGDIVKVKVLAVDVKKKRISLSMKL